MNGSSDNWLTTFDYDGTSFFFRSIQKHFCPNCHRRLRVSYRNKVSWYPSAHAKRVAQNSLYARNHLPHCNVDERFYCFYCESCKEYFGFQDIKKLEAEERARRKAEKRAEKERNGR